MNINTTPTAFTWNQNRETTMTLNNVDYTTTCNMLKVFESILPSAHETQDFSAVQALMVLGLVTGQIVRISSHKDSGLEA